MTFETVADNLRESFRVIAASRAPGEIRELRGVSIAAAGVAFQMFNAAFLSEPVRPFCYTNEALDRSVFPISL